MVERVLDLLVVGAGISGLGMAQMAKRRHLSCQVVEASKHIGGAIYSHCFVTPEGPLWAELGAHTCYNSYGNLLQMLEESGQLQGLQAKEKLRYWMQSGDQLKTIPSQLHLLELIGALPRLFLSSKSGSSVRDYFGGIIGRRNYRDVLGPALDAVVCQPASDFPADAIFRKKPRRKEVMRSFTGPSGLQSFVDSIAIGLEIRTQAAVTRLAQEDGQYVATLGNGEQIQARRVVLAVAPDVAAQLLQDLMPDLTGRLREIEMSAIDSQCVLLPAEATLLPRLSGIIGRDDDFFSAVSRDPVPDQRYRAFTFHFRPGRQDEAGRLARICRVLGVTTSEIISSISIENRLPALRLGHAERIQWIDERLAGESLGLTGNWFQGVSIEDSLVRSASESLRLLG
jgi:protoporphyrinogen/coproporphyrinogen III oxidase